MSGTSKISKKERVGLWVAAAAVSGLGLLGLPLNIFPLLCVDFVGLAVFLVVIGGPHGGGNRLLDSIGVIAGGAINLIVLYYLFKLLFSFWKARRPTWES